MTGSLPLVLLCFCMLSAMMVGAKLVCQQGSGPPPLCKIMAKFPDLKGGGRVGGGGSSGGSSGGWQIASGTHYFSYAPCCKGNPNYDPKAEKKECEDYSACKYAGEFTGLDKKLGYDQVKNTNIVSFYDAKNQQKQDKNMSWWLKNVKGRKMLIKHPKTGKVLEVSAYDTCGDWDCNGCCTEMANKNGGVLIDMEYNTAQRFYGKTKPDDYMQIQWKWAA